MPDPKTPPNEKTRKTRSFGSYALFLFVLIAIFIFFGGQKFRTHIELTQDQYKYKLYTGEIDSQEFKGANTIEGQLKGSGDLFTVNFAGLQSEEGLFQQLKATPTYRPIRPQALTQAIDGGWYQPTFARHVTAYDQQVQEQPGSERKDEGAGVFNPPKGLPQNCVNAQPPPPPPLPKKSMEPPAVPLRGRNVVDAPSPGCVTKTSLSS